MTARPPKPSRLPRNVRCRWSDAAGCWKFRAVMAINGHRVVGRFRATIDEAAADAAEMRATGARLPGPVDTLEQAIDAVLLDARARGVDERTIALTYEHHLRRWAKFWQPETPVALIATVAEVEWAIVESLENGRAPTTVKQKDLPFLQRIFAAAGVVDVVPEARDRMRLRLRSAPPRREALTMEEVGELVRRIRTEAFLDANGAVVELPTRETAADVVWLFALTGIRYQEAQRVAVADVDLERGVLHVRHAKNIEDPRDAVLVGPALEAAHRLVARARARESIPDEQLRLIEPWLLSNLFPRWAKRLGEPRLNARVLRRTFLIAADAAGATPRELMRMAGHRALSTTSLYLSAGHVRAADIVARVVDRAGPATGT